MCPSALLSLPGFGFPDISVLQSASSLTHNEMKLDQVQLRILPDKTGMPSIMLEFPH